MKLRRGVLAALIVIACAAIPSNGTFADTAATYLPPVEGGPDVTRMKLQADRGFGFAPMTVNLSGMLETREGDLKPISGWQDIRLVVESPFLHVQSGVPVSNVVSDLHYEATMAGPAEPSAFKRALEIRKPGRYIFRVHVINPDGTVLSSNEVTIRAM